MNLTKLFEIQAGLDAHIEAEHPSQDGEDRIAKKILALQVELGELANEWRGFKFWSEVQEPRYETVEIHVHGYDGPGQNTRASIQEFQRNPLLEEYVDCLHFILSIGLELGADMWLSKYLVRTTVNKAATITNYLLEVKYVFLHMGLEINLMEKEPQEIRDIYANGVDHFLGLGEKLGFTWEQIEQAYLEKNKINHERQDNGY